MDALTTSTLTRLAPTQVELEIPISADDLAAAEERAFRKLAKSVRLPGFRQGKVPRKVFEQTYGTAAITNQAIDEVVPNVYAKAVREHDLEPVERPKMEVVEEHEGRPLKVKATVEVRPEITLGHYKGLPVARPPQPVTDADVERSVAGLARERATLEPVDRPAESGDVVTVDYRGTIDGTPFEGGTAENQVTELSEGRFIPGFADGIAGMRAGESKDVEAHFPSDYGQSDLAGKTAIFHVTLHDVKRVDPPAIDDAFAASVSDHQTVDALRADVRRRLEVFSGARDRRTTGNAIMETLLARHDFALPPTMVAAEIDRLMNDAATRGGGSLQEYVERSGRTQEALREEFRAEAESRVKGTLLVEQIAKTEGIVATPGDLGAELEALARRYGQPVAKVREALGNGILALMDGIVRNKTIDFLVDQAEPAPVGAPQETPGAAS